MRKCIILLAAVLTACAMDPEDLAIRRAKAAYPDCDKPVFVKVDTITNRDNLNTRRYLVSRGSNAEKKLAYLDSMEIVHQDILDQPTAFRYTIAFDTPTNFVYVIQAPDGRNLGVSKDLNKLPLNPEDNYFYILPSQ